MLYCYSSKTWNVFSETFKDIAQCVIGTMLIVYYQVFSLFLETLVEFVIVHKADLSDWLFVLMTRLLMKMGADLLGSVLHKIQRGLDVVR